MSEDLCPLCGTDMDGGPIFESLKESYPGKTDEEVTEIMQQSYGSGPYRWSRIIGIELPYYHPQHIDGISYYHCPDCKGTWDRFTGKSIPEDELHLI